MKLALYAGHSSCLKLKLKANRRLSEVTKMSIQGHSSNNFIAVECGGSIIPQYGKIHTFPPASAHCTIPSFEKTNSVVMSFLQSAAANYYSPLQSSLSLSPHDHTNKSIPSVLLMNQSNFYK